MAEPVTTDPHITVADDARDVDVQEPFTELEGRRQLAPLDGNAHNHSIPSHAAWWRAGVYRRIGTKPHVVSTRVWTAVLMAIDGSIALLATFVGGAARFGATPAQLLRGPMYLALAATLPVVWVGAMFLGTFL